MAFRDCIVKARDGGEVTDDEADSFLRRFDELVERGLTPAEAKNSIVADTEAYARVLTARGNALRALEERGKSLDDFVPVTARKGTLYERLWGAETDDMAALDGSSIVDPAVAAEVFHETVISGRRAEVPDRVVAAAHDALEPYSHLLTEGTRIGVLKSITPSAHDPAYVRATFVSPDGEEFNLYGNYKKRFSRVRAGYDPKEDALLFFSLRRDRGRRT